MTAIATECTACPKGIKMCAHLGDRVVWLGDRELVPSRTGHSISDIRWTILGPALTKWCPCESEHLVMPRSKPITTDSLPDAKAEFERRCALLRAEA